MPTDTALGLPGTLANLGAVGVLVWFLWYAVTQQLPAVQERFHAELERERNLFRDELRASREHDNRQTELLIRAISDNQSLCRDTLRVVQETQKVVAEIAARKPTVTP